MDAGHRRWHDALSQSRTFSYLDFVPSVREVLVGLKKHGAVSNMIGSYVDSICIPQNHGSDWVSKEFTEQLSGFRKRYIRLLLVTLIAKS
jgi:hypothetical protein